MQLALPHEIVRVGQQRPLLKLCGANSAGNSLSTKRSRCNVIRKTIPISGSREHQLASLASQTARRTYGARSCCSSSGGIGMSVGGRAEAPGTVWMSK